MAASGTSTWPVLADSTSLVTQKARANEVETKFDWIEANLLPMVAGSTTSNVYDLGSTVARWQNIHLSSGFQTTTTFYADDSTSALATNLNGTVTLLNQSGAHAYRGTTSQTLTSLTRTQVQFNAELYDTKSEFDSATNYRFTANEGGIYAYTCGITLSQVIPSTTISLEIARNGNTLSTFRFNTTVNAAGETSTSVHASDLINLTATQYLEVYVRAQGTGTTLLISNGTDVSFFTVHKVA